MKGCELKTLRESLGLSVNWLGARLEVRERTINYWESDKRGRVPEPVAEYISRLVEQQDAAVLHAVQLINEHVAEHGLKAVTLVRYRTDDDLWQYRADYRAERLPVTSHGALLARIAGAVRGLVDVQIRYLEPTEYERWRADNDIADSDAARAEWAAGADSDAQ